MPFGRFGKNKDKKVSKPSKEGKKTQASPSHTSQQARKDSSTPSPASSTTELAAKSHIRVEGSVKKQTEYYETLTRQIKSPSSSSSKLDYESQSPERGNRINVSVSLASPTKLSTGSPITRTASTQSSGHSSMSPTPSHGNYTPVPNKRGSSFLDSLTDLTSDHREKHFDFNMPLPPLKTINVRLREIEATKNPEGGGFGFILRKSYLPDSDDPEKTKLAHLVEPRTDYTGPLMTGDRIIEVNGNNVEEYPHESVVEMIKKSGEGVFLKVASMPELLELNARGALDENLSRSSHLRKSGRGKAKHGTGTLRKQNKTKFKAKTEAEVLSEREGLEQDKVWVVHSRGFSLGTVEQSPSHKGAWPASSYNNLLRTGRDRLQVRLAHADQTIEVEDDDLEKANSPSLDKVEDLVDLVHLNESSTLHVLRQRYGSSLIHTFAGNHLVVLNPLKPLSSYVDRVIDMFRGCRRADMPPHIFAMGQQAYRDMMVTRQDQSLILMGLSGSGKTFNTRYLLRYLTTVGQPENGPVSNSRLDAVELLLHSFGSAATYMNPQATRCTCLYTLDFDPSGTVISASVKTYLLEKFRVAQRSNGEGNFNILYQLIAGADEMLRADLMLDEAEEEAEEANLYFEALEDAQRNDSAGYVWELIQNCLDILDISDDEAMGLWSLLAAIYHLGFAGVKKGQVRGADCFQNPAAAQRAAVLLGINHEVLGHYIFSPPRGQSSMTSMATPPPAGSDSTSITSSLFLANLGGNRSLFLDAFVMGLYDQAVNALVMLINRALLGVSAAKRTSSIHVVDMPGFQHRELAGARDGGSLDDLCMNYAQERLQMLFHDWTFTSEQDRYIQEEINWMFSETVASPLPVIDTIDRHIPQRRGGAIDVHNDRRGILWLLDEESVFPGATDSSFLDRVQMYHGEGGATGDAPLIKIIKEDNQFTVSHCQRSVKVLYDANGWVKRAREHPSFRVVVQVMAESKRECVASIFQGRGVAASVTTMGNSKLKADTHRSLSRTTSSSMAHTSSGIKKTSVTLQTKFQLDFLMDTLRKTHQWYIRCILPQLPHKLPGALPHESVSHDTHLTPGEIDIPLVRSQIRRAELVKATRIYKQGYPEHMSFSEFRRRYLGLVSEDTPDGPPSDLVNTVLNSQGLDTSSCKVGLSQAFFRAGTLARLDRLVEDSSHDTMVMFQARCRGWLGRQKFKQLQLQDSASLVIQQNVLAYLELREWSWWKLFLKVKPMLAIWRAETDIKDRDDKIEKLKAQVVALEGERDAIKESERLTEEKVNQLSAELETFQSSANEASEMMESEQLERREMEEQLAEAVAHDKEISQENEQLKLQIAEMSILARIKSDNDSENSETVMEKYLETRRELETLRQRVSSEYEDEIERLEGNKRTLEKRLADAEGEQADLHKTLNQTRKKATKYASEMNDLKLLLEQQQARNSELEKRQRRFDADLNACKEDATSETAAKEQLAKDKDRLRTDYEELNTKFKELEEEHKKVRQEKEDLESEVLSSTSQSAEGELTSLKRIRRDLEAKVEELEDELDEVNVKLDTLQQTKARLELANQTLKQSHNQELEGREQELEQVKNTMGKKLKSLNQQLEELHEEKHAAVKARRDLERDLLDYQAKLGDADNEKKLKKQVKKLKALYEDTVNQLEHEREMRGNSSVVKSLRHQLEDLQASETAASKAHKRLAGEVEELQVQVDELSRAKHELEGKVGDLSREKNDLENRVEEDQDEIDELLEKQRAHITQTTTLQAQITEANIQIEELEEAKQSLDGKVHDLSAKVSELESGFSKHQYEASEMKVKELEQKLEMEKSGTRRLESQIQRLRGQLERAQVDKAETVTSTNSDAMRRLQKQNRELRHELQEAERKEQDVNKKKRNAEAQVEELEAQLQNAKADLKNALKRIDTLHGALEGHEAYSDDDTRNDTMGDFGDDDDDLSSNASSYKLGELDEMGIDDLSDTQESGLLSTEGSGLLEDSPPVRSRTWDRRKKSREYTPKIDEEDEDLYSRKRRTASPEADVKLTKYSSKDDDIPRSRSRDYLDEDDDFKPRASRFDEGKSDIKTGSLRRGRGLLNEDEDLNTKKSDTLGSRKSGLTAYEDDQDDDDDDLEEFLLKQRERTRRLQDEGDSFEPISIRSRRSRSPAAADSNGADSSPLSNSKESKSSKQRRDRRRKRTIDQEQFTSPEHQARARANGNL